MEQLVARRAHNPKVVGSSPALATTYEIETLQNGIFQIEKYLELKLNSRNFLL